MLREFSGVSYTFTDQELDTLSKAWDILTEIRSDYVDLDFLHYEEKNLINKNSLSRFAFVDFQVLIDLLGWLSELGEFTITD